MDGRVTLHGRYEYADDLPLAGVISEARHVHLGVLLSALRPAARWTFRQQLAGKWATSTDAVARTTVRAGLAAARGTYEFARWADAGLAYRRLQALGGGASRDGAGAELGISPVRQVRLAVGAISSGSMIPTSRRWTTPRGGCTSISDSSSTRASSG